jgi:2-amino-4-hydroxy-6-hydroxymethyldihydropteridine diphosphokinase
MRTFLGLGANIGNREANLRLALRWISRRCTVVAVSSLYRSEAVVLDGADAGPDYLNAVCEVESDLTPNELLVFVKEIEYEMGRRPAERWGPRILDIDVLLCGDVVIASAELTVPHVLLSERNFVLVPLAELEPDAMHPVLKRTMGELAVDVDLAGLTHVGGPEWAEGSPAEGTNGDDEDDSTSTR